ncbi:hypothetical protein TWF679_001882 [Orbilia oligospora]|uniref:Uncharacterized protein n=1 Tax=Orbilia oligospora TaxID=2813651 RepID=A0A8H8VGU0_ORBOL|nr:hypothetical protein TWF679_001882 [Orbilia oligospora]
MQRYRLREELMDLAHTAVSSVEWTPPAKLPPGEPRKPASRSPARKSSETDLTGVNKPKLACTIGVRRVSVFNANKASTNKPKRKAAGTPEEPIESGSDETATTKTDEEEESSPEGRVVHDKITGEDGKVVPCLLCKVERTVEVRTVKGKKYFFPTKIFTPSNKMVKRVGGEVISGVTNVYGDAPYNADWTHEEKGELPREVTLYTGRACLRGIRFPYRDVMGDVSMAGSTFSYNDFVTEAQGGISGTIPAYKFTSRPVRWSRSSDSDITPGPNKGKNPTKPSRGTFKKPLLEYKQPVIHIVSNGICHTNVLGPSLGHFNPPNLTCTCGKTRASLSFPEGLPSSGTATTTTASQPQGPPATQASSALLTPPKSPNAKSRKKRKSAPATRVAGETKAKRRKVSKETDPSQSCDPTSSSGPSSVPSSEKKRKHDAVDGEDQEPKAKFPRIRLVVRDLGEAEAIGSPSAISAQTNPEATNSVQPSSETTTTQEAASGEPLVRRIRIKFKRDDRDNEGVSSSPKRPDDPRWPYSPTFLAALTPQELAKLHSSSPKSINVPWDDEPPQLRTRRPPQLLPHPLNHPATLPRPYEYQPEDWNPVLGRHTLVHPESSECWVPDDADTRDAVGIWRCPKIKESGERYFKTLEPLDNSLWWIWDPKREYYFDGVFLKSRIHDWFSCRLIELGESVTDDGVYDRYGFF